MAYRFGARYVFDLAFDSVIKVAALSHPFLLQIPGDLEKFKATGVPLLIQTVEFDHLYPLEAQKIGDDILGEGKMETTTYKRTYFAGVSHSYGVRADPDDPAQKKGREDAFDNVVQWFKTHL